MSGGLPWAQIDSAFPQDPKIRRLERRLSHRDYLAALGAWLLILADAWRTGDPEEGVCADDLLIDPDLLDALQGVHLLNADGRIPRTAWEKWGQKALAEVSRRAEQKAALASAGGKARAAQAPRDRGRFGTSQSPAVVQPSAGLAPAGIQPGSSRHPAGSSLDRDIDVERELEGSSRGGPGETVLLTKAQLDAWNRFDAVSRSGGSPRLWEPVKRAWMGRGLRLPPTEKQRAILWEILDSRPMDLPRWIREAPPDVKSGTDLLRHVLDKWHAVIRETARESERRNGSAPGGIPSLGEILKAAASG